MSASGEDSIFAQRVLVEGRVQGVGFRWHMRLEARSLGLSGWVRNLDDGRVEAHIEGRRESADELLEWMASGPSGAAVESLEVDESTPTGSPYFEIR